MSGWKEIANGISHKLDADAPRIREQSEQRRREEGRKTGDFRMIQKDWTASKFDIGRSTHTKMKKIYKCMCICYPQWCCCCRCILHSFILISLPIKCNRSEPQPVHVHCHTHTSEREHTKPNNNKKEKSVLHSPLILKCGHFNLMQSYWLHLLTVMLNVECVCLYINFDTTVL